MTGPDVTKPETGDGPRNNESMVLCQPDPRKGCSACCGLFNFRDISREHLSRFLGEGAARSSACIAARNAPDEGDRSDIRDFTSYICPHQGLLDDGKPGCLLHPAYRTATLRNESFFGEKICNGFLCPAHSLLTAEHKRLVIDRLDDWYAYSIALIDPLFTSWLIDFLKNAYPAALLRDERPDGILHECLMIHARRLAERTGPVFFYSIAEYSSARTGAVQAGRDTREDETGELEKAIRKRL